MTVLNDMTENKLPRRNVHLFLNINFIVLGTIVCSNHHYKCYICLYKQTSNKSGWFSSILNETSKLNGFGLWTVLPVGKTCVNSGFSFHIWQQFSSWWLWTVIGHLWNPTMKIFMIYCFVVWPHSIRGYILLLLLSVVICFTWNICTASFHVYKMFTFINKDMFLK